MRRFYKISKFNYPYNSCLLEKYTTLVDIKNKYYADIEDNIFNDIIKADPTYNTKKQDKMGKYTKWLLQLYRNNKIKFEDLYKATEYLNIFNKVYKELEYTDINKYTSLPQLFKAIQPYYNYKSNSEKINEIKQGADKVYEDDTWLIIIPRTKEASIYYGKGTQWCTAASKSNNYFDSYSKDGPLYININKQTGRKYQFHFESDQLMNEQDEEISTADIENSNITHGSLCDIIGVTDGMYNFYKKQVKQNLHTFMQFDIRSESEIFNDWLTQHKDKLDKLENKLQHKYGSKWNIEIRVNYDIYDSICCYATYQNDMVEFELKLKFDIHYMMDDMPSSIGIIPKISKNITNIHETSYKDDELICQLDEYSKNFINYIEEKYEEFFEEVIYYVKLYETFEKFLYGDMWVLTEGCFFHLHEINNFLKRNKLAVNVVNIAQFYELENIDINIFDIWNEEVMDFVNEVYYLNEGFDFNQTQFQDDNEIDIIDSVMSSVLSEVKNRINIVNNSINLNLDFKYNGEQLEIIQYHNFEDFHYFITYDLKTQALTLEIGYRSTLSGIRLIYELANALFENKIQGIYKVQISNFHNSINLDNFVNYFKNLKIYDYIELKFNNPRIIKIYCGIYQENYKLSYNQHLNIWKWVMKNISAEDVMKVNVDPASFYDRGIRERRLKYKSIQRILMKLWKETH